VCDGLAGLPDAVASVWPQTIVQNCVVHLIRASFRYASRRDWSAIARDLKPIYTAPTEAAALERLADFAGTWEAKYPAIVKLWESSWAEFVPFLSFAPAVRQVIYTTNAIVILSRGIGVWDVSDKGWAYPKLRAERGYVAAFRDAALGRFGVCATGGGARLAA
jgi:transposase-like protein